MFPVFRCPPISFMTANEKDFSLALEMTVWGSDAGTRLSLLPMEGGAPKGRRLASQAPPRVLFFVYRSLFPSRMKRREPRAYGVRCFPFSDVLSFLLDRKRKRFLACARNDGMGKRYSRIASFLTRKGFVCRHARSKSFCCLSGIKKEHCHRAMLFLTFCAYQKYSFQTRKIVPSGKFRRACILIPALRARG